MVITIEIMVMVMVMVMVTMTILKTIMMMLMMFSPIYGSQAHARFSVMLLTDTVGQPAGKKHGEY